MPRTSTGTAGARGGPGRVPTPGLPAGSWSRVYGLGLMLLMLVFVMFAFRGRVPHAVDRVFANAPVDPAVVAKHREEVKNLQGGAWFDPPDGTGFAETDGYRRLLLMMIDHARTSEPAENPPPFDREQATLTPDAQRAGLYRVRGYVAGLWAQKLDHPVFELTDVWRVVVTDEAGEGGIMVDVMERPPAIDGHKDLVQLDAWFYRLLRYENPGGKTREVPYLLAHSLKVVPEEAKPTVAASLSDPANIVLLIVVAAVFAFATVRVINSRRRPTVRWRAPHLHSSSVPPSPEG